MVRSLLCVAVGLLSSGAHCSAARHCIGRCQDGAWIVSLSVPGEVMRITKAALVVVALAFAPGCTLTPQPAAGPASARYEPMYYDGYAVYYDDAGQPYYHMRARRYYV